MSRSSASAGSRQSPGAAAARSGQGLGLSWQNRRKSVASAPGRMARLPCTVPGATPAVAPLNSPRRIISRTSRPVFPAAGGARCIVTVAIRPSTLCHYTPCQARYCLPYHRRTLENQLNMPRVSRLLAGKQEIRKGPLAHGRTSMTDKEKWTRGVLVQRQGHAPPADRIRRRCRRARRDHAGAGAVAGRVRPGQAVQDRHAAAAFGRRRRRRKDRARRHPDGRRPHQQGGRHQWPADRADHRRLRVETRRRAAQGREARGRGQGRHSPGRVPLQRLPRLHAGVRRAQDRQHDRRVPRHHDHHQQMQPLHLPAVRLCAGAGRGVRALSLVKMGKRWHITYADYAWGQSTKDAYAEEIKKAAARWWAPPASRSTPPT